MVEFFINAHPVVQALLAGCFTWFLTALGSAVVFLSKELNRKILDGSLGFAVGVMLSASFWSLILPAVKLSCCRGKYGMGTCHAGIFNRRNIHAPRG